MAWHTVVVQKPGTRRLFVRPFLTNCISKELHCLCRQSLIVKCWFPRITAFTWSTVLLVRAIDGWPVCGSSSMDVRPFLNWEYHSNVLDRLSAVSSNACCSISYISVAVYQVSGRTLCKHVAPSTHPFHNTMEGQTRLHCTSTHSRLSQAATCSAITVCACISRTSDKSLPSKIGVRLKHGILCPFLRLCPRHRYCML
jgi:hypothetical protein